MKYVTRPEIDEATIAIYWRQLQILMLYFTEQHKRVTIARLASIPAGRAQAAFLHEKTAEAASPLYTWKCL